MGLTTDGHHIDTPNTIEIARGQVFDRYAARVNKVSRPLRAGVVLRVIDAKASPLLRIDVVTDTDDQLFGRIIINVRTRHGMAPFQLIVQYMPSPQRGRV